MTPQAEDEPRAPPDARRIFTVGHSDRSLEDLFALLDRHAVRLLADVRAFPTSRRHPHFGRDALAAACSEREIEYHWLPGLGGRRRAAPGPSPNVAWQAPAFRNYADYMGTADFARARAELEALAARAPTAYMCAEALWWQCHRRLVSDSLLVVGWDVEHIGRDGALARHRLPDFARVAGGGIVYDRGTTPPLLGCEG